MTETEAKTKWCPMVRIAVGDGDYATANRGWVANPEGLIDTEMGRCIGSACMMWRWIEDGGANLEQYRNGEPYQQRGYCGLAGK